jgi:pimeloyl-ACP methyl ester carboxylesterase
MGRGHDGDGCTRARRWWLARRLGPCDASPRRSPSVAVELPSCLPESALDDAATVRLVLDECVGPVVLAGHSWGGMVLTEVGTHPSVKRLVYLDALMLDAGDNVFVVTEGQFPVGFIACAQANEAGFAWDPDALTAYLVGRGWSAVDAREAMLGLRPQRAAASVVEPTRAAWRSVPSTFVSCEDSEMSSDLRALFASRATDVIKMSGDHFPNWLRPREVADILARIAEVAVDQ